MALMLISCEVDSSLTEGQPPEPTHSLQASITAAPDETPTKAEPFRIAIYTDMPMDEPEIMSIIDADERHKGRIVWQSAFPDSDSVPNFDGKPQEEREEIMNGLIHSALQLIEDPSTKAMVFVSAGKLDDPYGFLDKLKEAHPDMFFFAIDCYPSSLLYGVENCFAAHSDLVLSVDEKKTAIKAVTQAKRMGATAIVDFTTPDRRYHDIDLMFPGMEESTTRILPEIRETLRDQCEKLCISYYESVDYAKASQWLFHQIGVYEEYGKDICFLSSNCGSQMLSDMFVFGRGIIVQLCHPGLFHVSDIVRWPLGIGEEGFGDLSLKHERMEAFVESNGFSGRFATWRVPFSMAATAAAVEYAIGYQDGEILNRIDICAMRSCFSKAMEIYDAGEVGVELQVDTEYDNSFLFTQDYFTY